MAETSRYATTRQIPTAPGRLHVTESPGDEPALVLMHPAGHLHQLGAVRPTGRSGISPRPSRS